MSLLAAFALLLIPASAKALTLGFDGVSNNDVGDTAIAESQLSVEVIDPGNGEIQFTFENAGPEASSITDVYFDDAVPALFSGVGGIIDSDDGVGGDAGVDFSEGASPGNLPSGNTVGFSSDISADSDAPAQHNGVNPGESLGILLTLNQGFTYDDVAQAIENGELVIGIHVQGFESGGSESLTNELPNPEPTTMTLIGIGLVGLFVANRKRKKKTDQPVTE